MNGKDIFTDSKLASNRYWGCDSFCEQNINICKGTNTQFNSVEECVRFCYALPHVSDQPSPSSKQSSYPIHLSIHSSATINYQLSFTYCLFIIIV
jgi:hypothetical protein